MSKLTDSQEWKALEAHAEVAKTWHMKELFAKDPARAEKFSLEACGLFLDYSKNIITDEIFDRNASLIVSSHNITEISELCDRAMLIHEGEMIFADELDALRTGFTKVQLVFKDGALSDLSALKEKAASLGLDVMQADTLGSVKQLIVRSSEEEAISKFRTLSPSVIESVPLTLEEIFIYELEVRGYGSGLVTES